MFVVTFLCLKCLKSILHNKFKTNYLFKYIQPNTNYITRLKITKAICCNFLIYILKCVNLFYEIIIIGKGKKLRVCCIFFIYILECLHHST